MVSSAGHDSAVCQRPSGGELHGHGSVCGRRPAGDGLSAHLDITPPRSHARCSPRLLHLAAPCEDGSSVLLSARTNRGPSEAL